MDPMMNDGDYLMHYGVLGMKWGIRKAEKAGRSYNYESHGQKKYKKKVEKLKAAKADKSKIAKAQQKHEVYKQRDKNRQKYAATANVGKSLVRTVAVGVLYGGNYARYRAAGEKRVKAMAKTVGAVTLDRITLGLTFPVFIATSKHKEMKVARAQIDHNKAVKNAIREDRKKRR